MTTLQILVDGKPAALGSRIGKGGEGEVFALADASGLAVKIYTNPDPARQAKVAAMVGAQLSKTSQLVAFPVALAHDRSGKFVGFTMRLVSGHKPLFELYSPGARKMAFPAADYRFIVRAAANIARAVAKVHEVGGVIGDINHSGILVSDKAIAALIDADSFQFGERFRCRVGVPEYTPPELQGQRLDGIIRTPNHDAFGLAVVIFQLLFMGRHPYVGRYAHGEMPIEKAIAEHRFAYSSRKDVGMTPPPGACQLTDFPPDVRAAFEAAFGRDPSARPTAATWPTILGGLESAFTKCSANELHYYPSAAPKCIWCRMEHQVGVVLFLPAFTMVAAPSGADPGAALFNLPAAWAAIERVAMPHIAQMSPPIPTQTFAPSSEAKAYRTARFNRRSVGVLAVAVAIGLFVGAPNLWILCVPLIWFGVHRTFAAPPTNNKFAAGYSQADTALQTAIEGWRTRCGSEELVSLKRTLAAAKQRYEALPEEQKARLAQHEAKRRENQLKAFLETFQIRRASIRTIGQTKEAILASYGIDTAADIRREAIIRVPGFGPTSALPLLEWRARIERRFVFNPHPSAVELQQVDSIRRDIANEASKLRIQLQAGAAQLMSAAAQVNVRFKAADPIVSRAHGAREQARADLAFLGIAVPSSPVVLARTAQPPRTPVNARNPRYPPTPVLSTQFGTAAAKSCPTCGGSMVRRRNRQRGTYFMGCSKYPRCRGTRPV